MDKPVELLVNRYNEELKNQGFESALVDYLTKLAASSISQVHALNQFSKVKINMSIYVTR